MVKIVPHASFDHFLCSAGCITSPAVLFDGRVTGLLGKGD